MNFLAISLSFHLLSLLRLCLSYPAICPSPSLEYNGTRIQYYKQHVTEYTFQVTGIVLTYIYLLCRPTPDPSTASYCAKMASGEDLTVEMIHMELKVVTKSSWMTICFWFSEDAFKYGCRMSKISPRLEIRLGHDLLHLSSGDQLPHSSTLLMRCHDQTAAMAGAASTQCQDGRWSNNLPICRTTPGPGEYSGDTLSYFNYFNFPHILFADSLPPRLQFSVSGSSWSIGRVGQLIVRPGAIVHLDCIADRRRGNPAWI